MALVLSLVDSVACRQHARRISNFRNHVAAVLALLGRVQTSTVAQVVQQRRGLVSRRATVHLGPRWLVRHRVLFRRRRCRRSSGSISVG